MKTTIARAITALSTAALLSGCAASLRNPDIADVQRNAGHYSDRTVTIDRHRDEFVGGSTGPLQAL
jgi:hypothetical protein